MDYGQFSTNFENKIAVLGLTFSFHSFSRIRGLILRKLRFGRKVLLSSIIIPLITPAMPLAPSKCPTFVLMDPIRSGYSGDRPAEKTWASAPVSCGSPACVPVPWHSTYSVSRGSRPAASYTSLINSAWAAPLGNVIPEVLPSEFEPEPLMTARIVSLSVRASSNGFKRRQPTPSPLAYPFARSSNV